MSDLFQYEAHWLELEQSDTSFAVLVIYRLCPQGINQDFASRFR
ncbi:hypothetical protein [Nostoc sp. XA010]|nr:hypothetical protein [Nostoc sp. XA010]